MIRIKLIYIMANYKDYLALLGVGTVAYLGYKIYDYIKKESKKDEPKSSAFSRRSYKSYSTSEDTSNSRLFDFTEVNKLLRRKKFTKKELRDSLSSSLESQELYLYSDIRLTISTLIDSIDPDNKAVKSITIPRSRECLQYIQDSQNLDLEVSLKCYRILRMALTCTDEGISESLFSSMISEMKVN